MLTCYDVCGGESFFFSSLQGTFYCLSLLLSRVFDYVSFVLECLLFNETWKVNFGSIIELLCEIERVVVEHELSLFKDSSFFLFHLSFV